jgi:hypothetical protein
MILLDNKDCVDFLIDYIDDSYSVFELPLKSNSPISSDVIYTFPNFIRYIETEYRDYINPLYSDEYGTFLLDGFNQLKSKLREQIIDKIINE